MFGFHLNCTFFAPQLSSDAWHSIAELTSAFGNTYDDYLDAFAYADGNLRKFDVSIINTGDLIKINVFLPSDMSEKKFSLKFYVGRAGRR